MNGPFGGPSAQSFNRGRVTNPNQSEIIKQRLYDWQLYPAAGVQQLSFFAQAVGQGVTTAIGGVAGSAKSLFDTNLELPNTLPSGKEFQIDSIEVVFFPGAGNAANTYTIAQVSQFNANAAAAVTVMANDVNTFYQSGMLELNVLSKNYLRESPLMCFPPKADLQLDAAVATNAAVGTGEIALLKAKASGRPYYIDEAPITLMPSQNFNVNLLWPTAVPTPSGFNARVGVILDGWTLRASQ